MGDLTKAVLFDLDGTLLNTLSDLTDATNASLSRFGLNTVTEEEMPHFIGNGVQNQFKMASRLQEDNPLLQQIIGYYKNYYKKNCCIKTKPYNGIIDLLQTLKNNGFKTAIVSNKPDEAVQILQKKLLPQIDYSIGQKESFQRKPAPDMVLSAMNRLGVSSVNSIYVGDSDVDIKTAKNSGLKCISVSWGFQTVKELEKAGATKICSDVSALSKELLLFAASSSSN